MRVTYSSYIYQEVNIKHWTHWFCRIFLKVQADGYLFYTEFEKTRFFEKY